MARARRAALLFLGLASAEEAPFAGCWEGGYTFDACCGAGRTLDCFTKIITERECCTLGLFLDNPLAGALLEAPPLAFPTARVRAKLAAGERLDYAGVNFNAPENSFFFARSHRTFQESIFCEV